MAEIIKLTKSELRIQQNRLNQLQKYLPTLQLKKAMLQVEVQDARLEIAKFQEEYKQLHTHLESYSALLSEMSSFDASLAAKIAKINKRFENIAGVEVPYLDSIDFDDYLYSLFDTQPWTETVIDHLRKAATGHVKIDVAKEKKTALEKELRDVSIRVNLFEKILIPRALLNIKKIKVFLGDQQLAAVSQAKIAKSKIEARKKATALNNSNEARNAH